MTITSDRLVHRRLDLRSHDLGRANCVGAALASNRHSLGGRVVGAYSESASEGDGSLSESSMLAAEIVGESHSRALSVMWAVLRGNSVRDEAH
jgi:hypothetical protein